MTRHPLPYLVIALLVILSGLAAPQGAPNETRQAEGRTLQASGQAPALPGAPRTWDGGFGVALRDQAPLQPVAAMPSASPLASVPAPTGEVGTALYSASATWCAPRGDQCTGWAPPARLGAVNGFRWGDASWWARVWRGETFVDVLVVSHCACGGTDAAIDLSPAAFAVLAPLSRGRIAVAIEVLDWPVGDDPPPHPDDDRMRAEDSGPGFTLPPTNTEETQ